ncbi:double-stranded RNA-binding protein 1-like isoform X2 [Cannabis sativa]|uniref:double-stranded RNA-binding protein 1-like isoform X2 n=1 Tax=Cannabis sativa TaxID=3483 RepID=UPI0029CAA74B|nr:double-stranded RNA-binding protein 1-like isoform X2 [Cannabis sativa]
MYKSKLQELCHKNQWGLPKYTSMRYGPDHNPLFGASVSVNDISFDSLIISKSNKQAHNHAAMLAFLHFTSPPPPVETLTVEESDQNLDIHSNVSWLKSVDYIISFLDAVKGENSKYDSSTPIKTNKTGMNVEETSKSLEMQSDALGISDGESTPKSTWSSGVAYDLVQSLKHQCILVPHQPQIYVEAKEKFDTSAESAETIVSTMEVDNSYPAITSHMEKLNEAEKVSAVSSPSVTNSMSSDVKSYLLCNKVRVYSQLPNHPFPEDITVLPIREDKWVAVSLEFPNENN